MLNLLRNGPTLSLNALIKRSEKSDRWLAICLELDIIVEGSTVYKAKKNLRNATKMYLDSIFEDGDFESLRRPAPSAYWNEWANRQDLQHHKPKAYFNFVSA